MNTHDKIELPPLPEWLQEQDPDTKYPVSTIVTAMKQYAKVSIALDRQGRGEVVDATLAAHTDLMTYVLQDDVHNRLTPRVIDIAYTAFTQAKQPNDEDGGASDWFNDTKPVVMQAIEKLRNDLFADRTANVPQPAAPVVKESLTVAEPVAWGIFYQGVMQQGWGYNEEAARAIAEEDYPDLVVEVKPLFIPESHPAEPVNSDRQMILKLMEAFDTETWQCPSCGHAEDTATMDSAHMLRSYLDLPNHNEPVKVPSDVTVVGMPEFDALLDHIYENGTASEGVIRIANEFARAVLARYGSKS